MTDPCLFQDQIMRNLAETARQGQAQLEQGKALQAVVENTQRTAEVVENIEKRLSRMNGFFAGMVAMAGLLGASIGWVLKAAPAIATSVIK